jgi:type II secretory ATPase GspE/PulE/Tfp pilus assembly ATPase PilB-like protein
VDEDLRRAINESASQQAQFELVRKKGFRTYREEGADKLVAGITTIDEILQAS